MKFHREQMVPPPFYEPFLAMVRAAFTDRYADMAGIPKSAVDLVAKPAAAMHDLFSSTVGGLGGGSAKKVVGVNPYDEILGVASKAFNQVELYALTHDKDDQPQMHQDLHDDR
ncbi:hypothetical protein ACFIN9_31910 [Streptomyces noursei]|uniref:hypothetical protein n=1 Tax=Streptomyces noursei TaxID=1971 RepID=UPI0036D3B311